MERFLVLVKKTKIVYNKSKDCFESANKEVVMRVGIRILFLSLTLVFCSALMSGSLFISSAYAQFSTEAEGTNTATTEVSSTGSDAANSSSSGVGSGWDVGASVSGSYASKSCSGYQKDPFKLIACKAATTLEDLRIIVYVIAGFGLIAFAFAAIFGKISFKHLSQIAIGLFLVSMTAPFIEYFVGSGTDKLVYGDYLTVGNFSGDKTYFGAENTVDKVECDSGSSRFYASGYCKDETVTEDLESDPLAANSLKEQAVSSESSGTSSSGSSSSSGSDTAASTASDSTTTSEKTTAQDGNTKLADLASDTATEAEKEETKKSLKDSVKDIISVVKAGSSAVGAAKDTIKDVGYQTSNVVDAIKNRDSGLSGIIDVANTVASAGSTVTDSTYRLSKNLESNISTVADGIQDLNSSNEQRAANQTARASGQATNTVSSTIQGQTVGSVVGGLSDASTTAYQNQQTVGSASNDANSMANIFGGTDSTLGQAVGIGILTGSTVGGLTETGTDASATAAAREAAAAKAASEVDMSNVKSVEFSNSKMIYKDANGNVIGQADYNQSVVPSGAVRADVSSDGSLVFYDANGNKVGS